MIGELKTPGICQCAALLVFVSRLNEEAIVLGQRGKEPNRGKWVIPGGGMLRGESHEECALREFKEETGGYGRIDKPLRACWITLPDRHILVMRGRLANNEAWRFLKASSSSDLLDVQCFSRAELDELIANDGLSPVVAPAIEIIWPRA